MFVKMLCYLRKGQISMTDNSKVSLMSVFC